MEIKIKSTENGWVTDRQMTLPDDRKLTDAILRTVRRYQRNQEKAASEKDSQDASTATAVHAPPDPTEEDSTADVPAVPTVQVPDEEKDSSGKVGDGQKEKGYRGFLLVKCAGCGKLFFAYARYGPMKEIHCRDCGKVTELRDVAPAALHCGSCGKKWDYLTNSIDADISCACANCGAEMRSWWEPKKKMYLPPK